MLVTNTRNKIGDEYSVSEIGEEIYSIQFCNKELKYNGRNQVMNWDYEVTHINI